MAKIQVLSEETIDKIAAGEVIERPSSIVKELVENAIDAGASAITVEIKEGGISFIRITDNGCGIEKSEVRNAFCRHATSKITSADEIETVLSLGFRGEALSSIAAIAQIEMITKTKNDLTGVRYLIEGTKEKELSEVGVPCGTTIIVRNIFFNTPVRRKFLKSPTTEAGYISDVCEHLALSRPDISIKYINAGQVKFHTSGDGDLKELIYRIYGKDAAKELIPFKQESKDITIEGYLGKPTLNRSNRNFENYFINGRYIKSNLIAKAVEEGYRAYLMQHKFPFFILNIKINTKLVDINVHPTKMEVRFSNQDYLYDYLVSAVAGRLKIHEMIPDVQFEEKDKPQDIVQKDYKTPEPFETKRMEQFAVNEAASEGGDLDEMQDKLKKLQDIMQNMPPQKIFGNETDYALTQNDNFHANVIKAKEAVIVEKNVQMNLFEDKILTKENVKDYNILGQIFNTYWLILFQDKLMIMDQHAAHEKVKFEALMKKRKDKTMESQSLNPPIIISLSGQEMSILDLYRDTFEEMGFEIEDFGGNEIAIRSVPLDLYGTNEKEMFLEVLDSLNEEKAGKNIQFIYDKIASMACKAAVKGNHSMSVEEVKELINELLTLDNPYNCPHGRPTMITISQYEIEKKFKRIV